MNKGIQAGLTASRTLRLIIAVISLVLAGRPGSAGAQTLTTLWSFSFSDGAEPLGALVQGSDSNFYGTTYEGGTGTVCVGGCGAVFQVNPGGETTLHSFIGSPNDGASPLAGLVQGSDGNFYGTTTAGGTNNAGTVFTISSAGTLTTLYSFSGGADGAGPLAGLVQGSDSNFYGTTSDGGVGSDGTVFTISPAGTLTILYSFSGGADGASPLAGLVVGSDSNFYGTTSDGGAGSDGTVFNISPAGTLTTLHSFGVADGSASRGVVQGSDGNFYGVTGGGTNIWGTVFTINPQGTLTTLHTFNLADGSGPNALMQGSDGNFYGTTVSGGTSGAGTVFKMVPAGTLVTLVDFTGAADGDHPQAALVQGGNGNFYGTTTAGGTSTNCPNGCGTVFELSADLCISLESTNETFTSGGGFGQVMVTATASDCLWTAGSNGGFITIDSTNSGAGNGSVSYTVAPNTNAITRTGSLSIAGQALTISQAAAPCAFLLDSTNAFFGVDGGESNVMVEANGSVCGWTAVSENAFITITSEASGSGNGAVGYTVAANPHAIVQTGTMTIAGQIYTVSEAAAPCSVSPETTAADFVSTGGPSNVAVIANGTNCSWTAASNDGFISITAGVSGSGNGTVDYTVAANTNHVTRPGSMTIAGQTFTVTQGPEGCRFSLSSKNVKFKNSGGPATVKVIVPYTECAWTAASNDPFITVTAGDSGAGKGAVSYTVASNADTVARLGTMTIASEIFTVDQAAATCEFSLGETNAGFGVLGGSSNVTVTANGNNCPWKAVVNGSFIKITSGTSGAGDATVNYTVSANTKPPARKGAITIGKEKLTILQSGAP